MYESLAHAMLDALTAMSPNASATVCASLRRSGSMGVSSKLATASASPGSVALIATPLRLYATTSKVADRQGSLTRTRILFHSRCFRHRVWRAGSAHRAGVRLCIEWAPRTAAFCVSTCRAAHCVEKMPQRFCFFRSEIDLVFQNSAPLQPLRNAHVCTHCKL